MQTPPDLPPVTDLIDAHLPNAAMSARARRPLLRPLFGFLLCAGAFAAGLVSWALRDQHAYRVSLLAAAGSIDTGRLGSAVSVDTVVGPASVSANAAGFYAQALNSWNARTGPYLKKRALDPFVVEPMPNPAELHLMRAGAACQDCDFYSKRLTYFVYPGKKPWPFEPAVDPFAMRPYTGTMRLLAQGVLNMGKKRERAGKQAEATQDYQMVVRFGWHLRQHPGSILDVQLGLEMEQKGLHYLDVHYGLTKQTSQRRAVWKYGDSLKRLSDAMERKFTQLGNPEAAMVILRRDAEPVWRVQAAAALKLALDVNRYGWLEQRDIRRALEAARHDTDRSVRQAVAFIERRPPTPDTPQPLHEEAMH
jgi:hypothetical protein